MERQVRFERYNWADGILIKIIFRGCLRGVRSWTRLCLPLLDDLSKRGLLEETLVVLATEFGRTPNINVNDGRDHYPKAFSCMLAGGGIRGGQVWGSTDEEGRK